jgi:hypothetical protein
MIIPEDKQMHRTVGKFIAAIVIIACFFFQVSIMMAGLLGVGAALAAGIAKEIYDKVTGKGTPEKLDIVWTAIGGIEMALWLGFGYLLGLLFI